MRRTSVSNKEFQGGKGVSIKHESDYNEANDEDKVIMGQGGD